MSDSLPEEQQQQRPPQKRKNADPLPRPREAQENIAYDEDEEEGEEEVDEEGAISSAPGRLQIPRRKINPTNKRPVTYIRARTTEMLPEWKKRVFKTEHVRNEPRRGALLW